MDSKVFFGIVRWVANVILILLGMNFANYFLPNVRLPWRWFTPGTSFVVLTLVLAPITFDFYLEHAYSLKVYGALAGIIIFMVWIYIASLVVLIGAETDTAIQELTNQETSA
jgi:membrane protein